MTSPEPATEKEMEGEDLERHIRRPLTAFDRCDRCQAQAYVRVTTRNGELVFCGHHYARYEPAFLTAGYLVDDSRHNIDPRPPKGG